ncbi:hypothetical protein GTP46_11330 [Duganella sp. FT135W]|uniref:Uncharacterized protein n=1 Tax=Duganella flavida TaxID=2692175 RepID=A0A6L8KAF7_9BURK|nr:hypothetical protein [Duganella flavida]MYM23238.1 hypothetical protein [Duganella flavida]
MKYKFVTVVVNLLDDPPTFSEARTDVIDTQKSRAFDGCNSLQEVEAAYEAYCNYQASPNRIENPSAKVKVLSVEPIQVS